MRYDEIIAEVRQLEKSKPVDHWRDIAMAPLLTKKIFSEYGGEIPDEDIISLKIDTRGAQQRNPFNCLICAATGIGKDRLLKNMIKAFIKQEYRVLHIEPKGIEMLNAKKKGKGTRLHPLDKNETLPIVGYCPNYIRKYLETNFPELIKKVKFYSPDIKKMDYVEIWQSFGIPTKIAAMIVEMIEKGHTNLEYFEKHLSGKFHHSTNQAIETALASLKATNYFYGKALPLEEEWNKGNMVNVMFISRDGTLMNTDIGLILDLVRDIGIKESRKGLQYVTKKLIIFNDIFYYAGLSATLATKMTGGVNLAIRNITNCQNNFRTWGIDTICVCQSPDSNAVIPALIDGCTTKFVSYVENPQALVGKLPYDAVRLIANTNPRDRMLYIDEEKYVFEWVYAQGKTRWQTGFALDCSVGHT